MEVDLIPLSQLPSRYGIARSNLYNRLKDLKIESTKQGRKAFITAEQLHLLDRLHAHLETGGTINDFLKQTNSHPHLVTTPTTEPSAYNSMGTPNGNEPTISLQQKVLVGAIEAVVKRLIPTNRSRLNYLRELEEAYEKGWLLSTSEIADLLGLNQKTISNYGIEFTDAGFIFARAGTRKGGEIAWSIDKQSNWVEPKSSLTKGVKEAFSDAFDP
jgi:DNA-binding transcriptional regulator YhcF (GntR family)